MDKPDAWMPHYIGDYSMETIHLTAQQDGFYMRLRAFYWKSGGPIPADYKILYRAARASSAEEKLDVDYIIDNFFIIEADCIRHSELDKRYYESWERYTKKSEAGKKAVEARELKKSQRSNDISNDDQTIPITITKSKTTTTTDSQQVAGKKSRTLSTMDVLSFEDLALSFSRH